MDSEKVTSGTFTQVPNVLFDTCDLPESAQILYLRMYRHFGYKGCKFKGSIRKLSTLVRMSKTTTDRMSKVLKEAGLITLDYEPGEESAKEVMVITILKAKLWQLNKYHYEVEEVPVWNDVCPNLGQHITNSGQDDAELGQQDTNSGQAVPGTSSNESTIRSNTSNTVNTEEENSKPSSPQEKPSQKEQKENPPSPSSSENKNKTKSTLSAEAMRIIALWEEIEGEPVLLTKKITDAALLLEKVKPTKEQLLACKTFCLKDNPEWYKTHGLDLASIANNWAKWRSVSKKQATPNPTSKSGLIAATPGSQYIVDELHSRGEDAFQAWLKTPEGIAAMAEYDEEQERQEQEKVSKQTVSGMRNLTYNPEPIPVLKSRPRKEQMFIKRPVKTSV